MFGGLDLKAEKKGSSSDSPGPSIVPNSNAFSFLNSLSTEPAASPPAPPSSAFSFLNSTGESGADPVSTESESTPALSAFSFLSSPPTKEPSEPSAPPAVASSFSFLHRSSSNDGSALAPETSERSSPSKPAPCSFISSPDVGLAPSVTVAGFVDPSAAMDSASQNTLAGAGVAFGKATFAPVNKKKRTTRARTAKVGVAANNTTGGDGSTSRPSIPDPSLVTAPASAPVDHVAASEASRKAEQFILGKTVQQISRSPSNEPSASESFSDTIGASKSVDSQDEMIQAAKAAVEEAKQLEKQHRSFGGALGGLFRPRSSETSTSAVSLQLSGSSSYRHSARTPTPTQEITPIPSSSIDNADMTPAEMLRREHDEVERAIAERQLNVLTNLKKDETETSFTGTNYYEPTGNPIEMISVPSLMKKPIVTEFTKKTPTTMFNDMMATFRNKVVRSMEEVAGLRKQRVELLDERFMTLAKERFSIQEKEKAEAQQSAAAEAEDFEVADRMQSTIANRERECIEYASILSSIEKAIRQLDSQKQQVVHGVSKRFKDIQIQLKSFKESQKSGDREDATEKLKRFEIISKRISAEQERLEQDLKHMERDETLVYEENEELEKSISAQTGEYEKQRGSAKEQLGETEKEIEELRKLLNAKQAKAAELRTEIAGHDESILMVRVKFQRQLDRVTRKKNTIRDNREEWEMEKKANDKQRGEHDLKVKAHSEDLLAHEKLMDSLSLEIEMADMFASIVSKEMSFGGSDKEDEHGDELMKLQANVVDSEARLIERKENLAAANSHLSKLEEEIESLELLIPQYEELKKSAAARRDFKAAGKASKDAKDASSRLTECENELAGEAQVRKNIAEEEVFKCQGEFEENKKIAQEKEKELGFTAMQRLAENVKRFLATKQSICGDAVPNSIKGVGAYVLDGQIELLMMEGKAFGEKYGGWDGLVADLDAPEYASAKSGTIDYEIKADSIGVPESQSVTSADHNDEEEVQDSTIAATKETVYSEFRDLTTQLKEVEEKIESAVANEEFDTAAEHEETLQSLLLKLGELNLSEEEMEVAMALPPDGGIGASDELTVSFSDEAATNSEVNPEVGEQPPEVEVVEDCTDVDAEETHFEDRANVETEENHSEDTADLKVEETNGEVNVPPEEEDGVDVAEDNHE